jgi:hypothetical protein
MGSHFFLIKPQQRRLLVVKEKLQMKVASVILKQFRLLIGAGEAKVSAPLSPTLGQFGISCQEFCQKFNEKTKNFSAGVPLCIIFSVLNEKKFEFLINSISFKEGLFAQYLYANEGKKGRLINIIDVYKLYIVQRDFYRRLGNVGMLFGTLKANKVKKILS